MAKKFDITQHILVPKHTKLSDKEKKDLLDKYNISIAELPKISAKDPAILSLKPKEGEIIKIQRESLTSGDSVFYRSVINA